MPETFTSTNTAPDGWRPAYDRAFLERSGLIFLGVASALVLAARLPGKAAFFAGVYAAYFIARTVEHACVRSQFWLSATAFGVAAVALVLPTYLWIDPAAAAVMATALILSVAFGVGRRIHPSWAMVLFAVPLALWCLGDPRLPWSFERQPTADVVALVTVAVALFVLSLSRKDARHALAERIGGRVRLDSGEVYAMDRGRVLRLGRRRESDYHFTVFTASLESPVKGRLSITRCDPSRLPPMNGHELRRTIGGVPFVAAFEHPSPLTQAFADGGLDDALEMLRSLRDPFLRVEGDSLRIETGSGGSDVEERLVHIGRAVGAETETVPRGAYR